MTINELRVGSKGVDWVQLAQDVGQNRAVVSTVMKLRVSYKAGNFLTDERVLGLVNLWAPRFLYIGQAFHYSPENAFYIFNQQIYFII